MTEDEYIMVTNKTALHHAGELLRDVLYIDDDPRNVQLAEARRIVSTLCADARDSANIEL